LAFAPNSLVTGSLIKVCVILYPNYIAA